MQWVRSIVRCQPALLAGLLFCALLTRILVPTGFMPAVSGGTATLVLCSGTMPAQPVSMHMPGMHHGGDDPEPPAKGEQPCAFTALSGSMLASADPILLDAALAFVFLLALLPGAWALPAPSARLRPPLRAPPATA